MVDLISQLASELRRRGRARAEIPALRISPAEWRTAAREAARRLGRPVETLEHDDMVYAALKDWPCNELEEQIHRVELHRTADAIAAVDWSTH